MFCLWIFLPSTSIATFPQLFTQSREIYKNTFTLELKKQLKKNFSSRVTRILGTYL